jgi:uracil-DNA glycosylase family 4
MLGKPEINSRSAKILLVGRDYGRNESSGHPFAGKAGDILNTALLGAGLRRNDVNITNVANIQPRGNNFRAHKRGDVDLGRRELEDLVQGLRPNLVVTLGNEASFALIPEWPSRYGDIFSATGIEDRRGYIFDGFQGKVLATIHPAAVARQWIPWMTLLTKDLSRAREEAEFPEVRRPKREVEIVI